MMSVGRVLGTTVASLMLWIGCSASDAPVEAVSDTVSGADSATADTSSSEDTTIEPGVDAPEPTGPDWSAEARIPLGEDRHDVLGLGDDLAAAVELGLYYAQQWPIEVTGIHIPYRPIANVLDPNTTDPEIIALQEVAELGVGFSTVQGMYDWLGLPPRNEPGMGAPYEITPPPELDADTPLGASILATENGDGLTFTCMACHSGRLLGRTVIGLANRSSRANEFFTIAKDLLPIVGSPTFLDSLGVTAEERAMFERSIENAGRIGATKPAVLGLDTSVAHISLSLARRTADEFATPDVTLEESPAETPLETLVADSKPLPWWTSKYKTRWFADGAVVAGNPLVINLLWNEIGRGTDLVELDQWLKENMAVVDAITAAVFAAPSPKWTDFFDAETIDVESAKRGQALFETHCASCHGEYDKGWEAADADTRSAAELLETTEVRYHEQTPVFDVGTDAQRAEGQRFLSTQIGRLAIYVDNGIVGEDSYGYVPPPLVGVFARYPYLHNNSVPTLCDMLLPAAMRPTEFVMGPSEDAATDFDMDCVGYPVGDAIPEQWWEWTDRYFDTTRPGLTNVGHDSMMVDDNGDPLFDAAQRADLVAYLKTL